MRLKCLVNFPMQGLRLFNLESKNMHYLLTYYYTADYLLRRSAWRSAHIAAACAAQQRGEMILGGAAGDPPDRAFFMFDCNDPTCIEAFVRSDPYVINGLVEGYDVQPWNTVVGKDAKNPF